MRVVGQAVRTAQAVPADPVLARIEIRLADHGNRFRARIQAPGIDVPDQHAVVGAVGIEQQLALLGDQRRAPAADPVAAESRVPGFEMRLAEDRDGFRQVCRRQRVQIRRIEVEHHDAGAGRPEARPVRGEQTLVDRIEGGSRREIELFAAERRESEAPTYEAAADAAVGVPARRKTRFVELIDVITAVAVMADEETVIGLVQGHTAGSPDAVRGGSPIGDAADERRVAREILGSERVACRNSGDLCVSGRGQNGRGQCDRDAHHGAPP